jgi:Asp-tRNA(Asn)/Glu-tRNA(Gln) amidotransferase A subunit family amidase
MLCRLTISWRPPRLPRISPATTGARYGLRVPATRHRHVREHPRRRLRQEVKRRILISTYVLSAGYYDAYLRAQKVRTLIKRDSRASPPASTPS